MLFEQDLDLGRSFTPPVLTGEGLYFLKVGGAGLIVRRPGRGHCWGAKALADHACQYDDPASRFGESE
jgi:hypothetical protein